MTVARLSACVLSAGFLGLFIEGCTTGAPPELPAWPDGGGAGIRAPSSAPASADLPDAPALGDYLAYAEKHSPQLGAARARWQAALERVPQVRALPDPMLMYRVNLVSALHDGPTGQALMISQMFPWFGKLALRGDAAARAAQAEHEQYQAVRVALLARVKEAYYEYAWLAEAVRIVEENLELLRSFESVARARYAAGATTIADLAKVQVELGHLEDRLRSLRELRGPVVARLNAALNRPAGGELPWPGKVEEPQADFSEADLREMLARANPELRAMDRRVAEQDAQVALARKEYYPDVTLGVEYAHEAPAIMGMKPMGDPKDPLVLSVGLNVPIRREKLDAGVREAQQRRWAAALERADRLNELQADLKMTLYEFQDAQRKIELYGYTLIPKARESIQVTAAGYQTAAASFLDLLDAQRMLLEFQLSHQRALADRRQNLARLERLVGRELTARGNAPQEPDVQKQDKHSAAE